MARAPAWSPVELHRRDRLRAEAARRRRASIARVGAAARMGWRVARSGGRWLGRAARRADRPMIAAFLAGAVAAIGTGAAWSTMGAAVTVLGIAAATIAGRVGRG